MKGRTFIVEASGWTGDCSTGIINFDGCSSCSLSGENAQKTIGGGATSVSWTTVSASQSATAQSIKVTVSSGCTAQSADSSNFNIVLPPSLSITASTDTSSLNAGSTFSSNINVVNNGETTARNVDIDVSGTGMSLQSGCSVSEIDEGANVGDTCVVKASTGGSQTVTFTVSASNADSASDSFSITVIGGAGPPGNGNGGGTMGGGPGEAKNASRRPELVPGVGLRNNTKLQTAIEKVLAKGKLSENAISNLIRLSNSITSNVEVTRNFKAEGGKSELSMRMKYKGDRKVENFVVHDKIPKTFASSSDNVTVTAAGAKIEIVEKDPEYIFLYSGMNPNQEIIITYSVDQEVGASVINETETSVYGENYEGLPPGEVCIAGEKRCEGNDLQECSEDRTGWRTIETCEYGCDPTELTCKGAPPEVTPVTIDIGKYWMWIVVVIVVIVVVILGVVFAKKRKKKKFKLPKPMPGMKTPPSEFP
ncbi:MAG: hypothetical protein GTN39_03755 [Candidatus Aenigmarchaeota archaeon]|nr:hypothetical protein [Candidatus Aenigmarchaeota archaeon]